MDFGISIIDSIAQMGYEAGNDLLNDIILTLSIKARSSKVLNGKPEYPGDWFLNPSFGDTSYEVPSTDTGGVLLVEQKTKLALKWLLDTGRAKAIDVICSRDDQNHNRINRAITATAPDDAIVTYTNFVEVQ